MFSATGNILSGSQHRPDIYTISKHKTIPPVNYGDLKNPTVEKSVQFSTCWLNNLGKIPGVSTITGSGRALLGIAHSIFHLASAIFGSKNRAKHLEEAKLGGKNIGQGLVEMIPVIGNIIMILVVLVTGQ